MSNNIVSVSDRIKESSYSSGTNNIELYGATEGFSSFSSVYSSGNALFYAITNGSDYEIGSGIFRTTSSRPLIERFPFRSSNGNGLVSFPAGKKEVYVTYPATHAVYHGSGISNLNLPESSGLAFWSSNNVLNYDSNIVWDNDHKRLGIRTSSPLYGIDVGGNIHEGQIRASGYTVGQSGIFFPAQNNGDSDYVGGSQLIHFEKNQLDQYAYDNTLLNHLTGTDAVLELSGVVNEFILFKQQNAGTFFAGPASGCVSPCDPAYPYFRNIVLDDIPFLLEASGALNEGIVANANNLVIASGALNQSIVGASGALNQAIVGASGALNETIINASGALREDLTECLNENPYCTVRGNNYDKYDASWNNDNQSTVNYAIFPFSHVESASEVSDWDTTNYWYTVPRSGTYAITADIGASYYSADGDVDNFFRLVTSGDSSITNYLATAIFMGDPADNNASSSWTVNVPSGELIYLEYQGQPRNFSKLSIHKI